MKIVIAPDSFKGALRSRIVGEAFATGWRSRRPKDEIQIVPLADGGEGTCEAVVEAANGTFADVEAHDPLMRKISVRYGLFGKDRAVMEMAAASGIELLDRRELDPLRATTYGSGEVLRAILASGVRHVLLGIGGSATVDGGVGMLQALGARFFDKAGKELPPGAGGGALGKIVRADLFGLDPRLSECRIDVACDVTNPLTGARGAAAVFGPQKGATPEMVKQLDDGLTHWATLFGDAGRQPGDGAAGGLGFMLRCVLHGKAASGAKLVIAATGLAEYLKGADWLITGEGCSDDQSAHGKLCFTAARTAAEAGVPAILCSGALRGDCPELEKIFAGCFSIASGPASLEEAIGSTAKNLRRTGASLAGVLGRNRS